MKDDSFVFLHGGARFSEENKTRSPPSRGIDKKYGLLITCNFRIMLSRCRPLAVRGCSYRYTTGGRRQSNDWPADCQSEARFEIVIASFPRSSPFWDALMLPRCALASRGHCLQPAHRTDHRSSHRGWLSVVRFFFVASHFCNACEKCTNFAQEESNRAC